MGFAVLWQLHQCMVSNLMSHTSNLLMKVLAFTLILGLLYQAEAFCQKKQPKVLVFSKTLGYRHASIKHGIVAIQQLGKANNFLVDTTEDVAWFNSAKLKEYKTVIFLSPTGEFFDEDQKAAFKSFIQGGGGFVGIHAATDCLFKWDWYGRMIGAYFVNHPKVQKATLVIKDKKHPATRGLPNPWQHTDEWYNFKFNDSKLNVLISLDEKSYSGGKNGEYHPISWYHKFEGGRVFYTGLGHTPESFTSDEYFLEHLLGGIKYALNIK